MKPVFTKFGDSKVFSIISNTLPSFSNSGTSHPSRRTSAAQSPAARQHYKSKNGAIAGVFGTNKELQAWPSAVSTTPGSPDANMHRFVDNKAAQIMFSHMTAGVTSSKPGSPQVDEDIPPRPPPKGKYYCPERVLGEKGELEIVVQRDWDIERGERGASNETERELLRDGKYRQRW